MRKATPGRGETLARPISIRLYLYYNLLVDIIIIITIIVSPCRVSILRRGKSFPSAANSFKKKKVGTTGMAVNHVALGEVRPNLHSSIRIEPLFSLSSNPLEAD